MTPYLIDVDDVILPWTDSFLSWARGSADDFNLTSAFANMEPISGAAEKLREIRAFNTTSLMVAVSSCGRDLDVVNARHWQLRNLPFDAIICLPMNASKLSVFKQFRPGVVIEDNTQQMMAGLTAGHRVIGFRKPWNHDQKIEPSMWVNEWSEITP